MSDSALPTIAIAITPMHRTEEGIWESGGRDGAAFYLVELVQGDGTDAEVLVECRDQRSAAFAARVAAATTTLLGLAGADAADGVEAFDEETAAILAANPTPEIALPAGEWRAEDEEEDEPPVRPS
ncbi:hypothetical protein [Roseomonas sp. AR75]|uniref:hypothetical protein n=1 Tax=Roseomonas sp. AR75 TaxID=2562311 RepID=UPI0010C001B3|nr:hypothetical protein [Roseomonas sp. AR75]